MNHRFPHTESDLVLADVKANPSGWQCHEVSAFGDASRTTRGRVSGTAWESWNAAEPL
jgi:hypothetical protein